MDEHEKLRDEVEIARQQLDGALERLGGMQVEARQKGIKNQIQDQIRSMLDAFGELLERIESMPGQENPAIDDAEPEGRAAGMDVDIDGASPQSQPGQVEE